MFAWLFWFIQCECPSLFFFTASAVQEQLMREWQNATTPRAPCVQSQGLVHARAIQIDN